MSEYYIKPDAVQRQADALWADYTALRASAEEIASIMRTLRKLTLFERELLRLKQAYQEIESQCGALVRTARTLDRIVSDYRRCETKILNHHTASRLPHRRSSSPYFVRRVGEPAAESLPFWWDSTLTGFWSGEYCVRVQQMLPQSVIAQFIAPPAE